jgi:Rib/alpha/Esp surface antigen-like repeat protein
MVYYNVIGREAPSWEEQRMRKVRFGMGLAGAVASVAVAAGLGLGAVAATPAMAADWGGTQPMHRLYNPNSGEHFYTASDHERDHLVSLGWRSEGEGWYAPVKSSTPVYRLYNPNAGDHHYTASKAERDWLVGKGWRYEGVGWYSSDSKAVTLYRQYNPNARSGAHNYTTSRGESDHLVSVGWRYEGTAWYGTTRGASQGPLADAYEPRAASLTVTAGDPAPSARSAVADAGSLPDGTTFSWAEAPDTSREGTSHGTVTIAYPDGTTDSLGVTVTVAHRKTMAEANDPRGAALTVVVGSKVDAKAAVADASKLPAGTTFSWATTPDTSKEGTTSGTVTVSYPDGTTDSVAVTVTVRATLMADEYQPQGRKLVVKQGNKPNPHCALTNEGDLPEGTKLSWKSVPSTKATGVSKATLVATYPDGSSDAVTVTVEVQDEAKFAKTWEDQVCDGITRVYRVKLPAGNSAADINGYYEGMFFDSPEAAQSFIQEEHTEYGMDVTGYSVAGPFVCAPDYTGWIAVEE